MRCRPEAVVGMDHLIHTPNTHHPVWAVEAVEAVEEEKEEREEEVAGAHAVVVVAEGVA
jgi:hypothetical protein